jgi:hypothetical protein
MTGNEYTSRTPKEPPAATHLGLVEEFRSGSYR